MLRDVIALVKARTDLTDEAILRELNFAYQEVWNNNELPNSLFEITVSKDDQTSHRITLPHYVGLIRGVKQNSLKTRIKLFDPKPYYQNNSYFQSPFAWRILGNTPLKRSIENATTVNVSLQQAESAIVIVSLRGPTDTASESLEELTFAIGEVEKESTKRFTDFSVISKDVITQNDVVILDSLDVEIAEIPNNGFTASNTVIQVMDKCYRSCVNCGCFDILYKIPAPVLYSATQEIPFETALVNKVMEVITMPKEGQLELAAAFKQKSDGIIMAHNAERNPGMERRIDCGQGGYNKLYAGTL